MQDAFTHVLYLARRGRSRRMTGRNACRTHSATVIQDCWSARAAAVRYGHLLS